jgi:hypothetical protein
MPSTHKVIINNKSFDLFPWEKKHNKKKIDSKQGLH